MAKETSSEKLCRVLSSHNFLKEFVFKDLYYYKDGKSRNEVCDCLIEFLDFYIIIEVKERGDNFEKDSYDELWLNKKVYKKAISQLKNAIQIIKNKEMITSQNDCGRIFDPIVSNKIIPMVVFLNMEISDYKKVYCSKSNPGLNINIFSMDDFEKVLKNIVIPYDIVNYLLLRAEYIKEKFPHLLFWEMNEANISIARIDNEEGFIRHYNFLHDKSTLNIGDLLESFIFICYNMEGNIEYGGENYLQILLRLMKQI